MKRAVLLLLLAAPSARASADGLDSASLGALATSAEQPELRAAAAAGASGLSAGVAHERFFGTAALDWRTLAFEAGLGTELLRLGPVKAWWGLSGILAPRSGVSAGVRLVAGAGAEFSGERWTLRPSLTVGAGAVAGAYATPEVLLPAQGALEFGWKLDGFMPFLRLAGGAELLAGSRITGRGDLAVGLLLSPGWGRPEAPNRGRVRPPAPSDD